MQYLRSYKFILALAVITLILIIANIFKGSAPKLVGSNPKNNGIQTNFNAPTTLEFDSKIDLKDLSFTIIPEEVFNPVQISEKKINLIFQQPLRIKTTYSINLFFKGKQFSQLNFSTPESQKDARFNLEVQKNMENKYPLMAITPYETSQFKTEYIDPLTLGITIKNPNLTSQEVIDEVKAWVTQNKGDVNSHKYVISTPSSSPKPAN